MKETREYWLERLNEDLERMKELMEKRTDALSDYDKTIAFSSPKQALYFSKKLVGNHIRYDKEQIKRFKDEQLTLKII